MHIQVCENAEELGKKAAIEAANILTEAIRERGSARIILSTGGSQFTFLQHLVRADVEWEKVEMFHLDEYIDLPISHPASFRAYLQERFLQHVNVKQAHLVEAEGDLEQNIRKLTTSLRSAPVDLGVIGIGENAHVAFNDPPADFETKEAFITVELDDYCKRQQVGEGWFEDVDSVPKQAITMTVHQIMQSRAIISCVPYHVKAKAIQQTLASEVTNRIPATILKTHPNWMLYLDRESASRVDVKAVD